MRAQETNWQEGASSLGCGLIATGVRALFAPDSPDLCPEWCGCWCIPGTCVERFCVLRPIFALVCLG